MKKMIMALGLAFACVVAHADGIQSTLTNQTQSTGTASAANQGQGNGNSLTENGAPQPSKTSITERNVSAGELGAFSSNLNAFDCHFTAAGANVAIAGLSVTAQGSGNDKDFCVKGWTQAELARQSLITTDPVVKGKLLQASMNVKCSLDADIYEAMVAAGLDCQIQPKDLPTIGGFVATNTDGKTVPVRYVPVYEAAQTK